MNAEHLLTHFDRLTDTPDAIPRLRRFILDLAVRGKLVEQDPGDEPASELLRRIAAEKKRLVETGEIKKTKTIASLNEAEIPFVLPANWRWSQIAEIGVLSPRNEMADDTLTSFVPMPMIAADYGVASNHEVRRWGDIKKGYTHFAEGDVGLAKITPCFQNGKSTVFRNLTGGLGSGTTELHIVRSLFVNPNFILLFLKCPYFIETGIPKMTGTAGQKRVPTEYFAHSPFPLPPLAEQHRIVAKVDELMALCDRLETERKEREATRDQLATASLTRLNAPDPDPAVFQNHASFALNNLTPLTTRPGQIKALRQTILNLAVRGKLVKQDPNDEPAAELLKRIAAEKKRLVENRKIRKKKSLPLIEQVDEPFPVPTGWVWSFLGNLFHLVTDGTHHTPRYLDKGIPFLSVKDVSSGTINFSNVRHISEDQHAELCQRCCPEKGDILLTKVGTTGIAVPIKTGRPFSIFVSLALLKFSSANLSQDYLCHLINSPFVRQQSKDNTQGIGNQNLVLRLINGFALPIPPLAEQRRIVAKVDELMAVCDRLEGSLAAGEETRGRLVEVVLHEALEPDGGRLESPG